MTLSVEQLVTIVGGLCGAIAIYLQFRKSGRSEISEDLDRVRVQRDQLRVEVERLTQVIIDVRLEVQKLQADLATSRQKVSELLRELDDRAEREDRPSRRQRN